MNGDEEKAAQSRFTVDEIHRVTRPRRRRARQSTPMQAEVDSVETKTRSLSGRAHTRRRSSPELVDGGEDREKPYDFSKTCENPSVASLSQRGF